MRGFSLLRSLADWLCGGKLSGRRSRPTASRRRPRVEPLEERRLLAVLYVNDDAAGLNTGASWTDAYTDLQSALTAAAANDEVWVAAGTYYPTSGTDQTVSFELKEDVALYGGFAGTETARDQRDWTTNVTTLSGDIGVADTTSDNSYHVVSASGISDARLDGFTITAGYCSVNTLSGAFGAGMVIDNASPTLANLVFSENTVMYGGTGGGGALYVAGSPTLENVVFRENRVVTLGDTRGGAMYIASGSPTLTDVVFESNTVAASMGGGCYGGALYQSDGTATLTNVVFRGNSTSNSYSSIAYCGGFYIAGGSATLTNATFYDNRALASHSTAYDYALQVAGGSATVTNSIFWGETYACPITGNATVTYSIVWGGYTGTGNLNVDPQFVDADNGDLTLQSTSPAIDAGTGTDAPTTDIDGTARPLDGNGDGIAAVDLGAYEAATLVDTAPVADAGGSYTVFAGSSVALSAAASTRSSTAIVLYEWDLDYDGTTFDVDVTGARPDFSAAALSAGDTRTVALRVTARSGLTSAVSTATVSVVAYEELSLANGSVAAITDATLVGVTANGASGTTYLAMSSDGRYVVFLSAATNLVANDTNGATDVFVSDLTSGTTALVSTNIAGAQQNGDASTAGISSDGRYVVFTSAATNLVANDTNGVADVFVKDLQTGQVTRASTDSVGNEADGGASYGVSITVGGRYVVFTSYADNLVADDTNGVADVFVKDLVAGTTTRVSTSSTGVQGDASSTGGTTTYGLVTSDGRYVLFTSDATNLISDDTNGVGDVFLKDLLSGSVVRVNTDSDGSASYGACSAAAMTADGRYILFNTGFVTVVLKDLVSGVATCVSTASDETAADSNSFGRGISADGRYVLFESDASNLVDGGTDSELNIFLKDTASGATSRITADGARYIPSSSHTVAAAISPDGRYVVFSSSGPDEVSNDNNQASDVFLKDLTADTTQLISARGTDAAVAARFCSSTSGSVSLDGRYTVFISDATNLVADDTNGTADVFVQDGLTGIITRVSTDSEGNQANAVCYNAYISSEGPYVVFNTAADNLVDGDTASGQKVFVKDLTTGAITLASVTPPPAEGTWGNFDAQAISADGRYVIYKTISYSGTDRYHLTPTYWLLMKDLSTDEITTIYSQESSEALVAFSAQSAFAADGRYVIFTAEGEGYVYDLLAGSATSLGAADSVAISGDGRYAVFASSDSLVADDTNGVADVYAKDLLSGDVALVSSDTAGTPANGESYTPSVSADGRYVVFLSAATNLVSGDTNGSTDAFVKDLLDGTLRCASNDAEGNPASATGYPAISADGRFVVYSGHRAFNPLLDAVPSDIALSAAVVVERAAAGTVVGTLSTTDADAGDTFTYTLVAGDGDADNGLFTIVGDQLVVLDLVDAQPSYSIRVRSTDALGRQSCEKQFTIEVQWFTETVGLYDPETSTFYLRCENSTGSADRAFAFGVAGAGWEAIVGDWDGDGQSGVGLYDPETSTFYLTNSFATGAAQYTFAFGVAGANWVPLAGDWNGDGQAGVGLYDPATSTFYLTDSFSSGVAEYAFGFGVPEAGWTPIVGDWNGDQRADVGLYDADNAAFYLTTERQSGMAQYMFNFGVPGSTWQPVAGDWNADGASGVGLYDAASSTFYLTNSLAGGTAETAFGYGPAGTNWVALAGVWTLDSTVDAEAVDQLDLSDLATATLNDLDAVQGSP